VQPRDVLHLVADEFGVTVDELVGRRRFARICRARHTAALLLREQLGLSYPKIGQELGGRDHATAHHAVQVAYGWRIDLPPYADRLEDLADAIHSTRSPAA